MRYFCSVLFWHLLNANGRSEGATEWGDQGCWETPPVCLLFWSQEWLILLPIHFPGPSLILGRNNTNIWASIFPFLILSECPETLELLTFIMFLKTNKNESFICLFTQQVSRDHQLWIWSQNSRLTFKDIKRNKGCHLELTI